MKQIESQLTAEIAVPNVRAQLHSFYWPEAGEKFVQDREEYYVSRYVEHAAPDGDDADGIPLPGKERSLNAAKINLIFKKGRLTMQPQAAGL